MNFRKLKVDIQNHADDSPNLYMALCMIQSLFNDIEDEADAEVSDLPVGNEKMPLMLTWLCNTLIDINKQKQGEFERGRDRLNRIIAEINEMPHELEKYAGIPDKLEAEQQRYNELEKKLTAAKAAKTSYDAISVKCATAAAQITELKKFSPEEAQKTLDALNGEIAGLTGTKTDLEGQIGNAETQIQTLKCGNKTLAHTLESDKKTQAELQKTREQLNLDIAEIKKNTVQLQDENGHGELENLNQEKTDLLTRFGQLQADKKRLDKEVADKQKINADYQKNTIDPLQKEKDEAEKHYNELLETFNDLKNKKSNCIIESAKKDTEIKNAKDALEKKQKELDSKQKILTGEEQKNAALQKQYDEVVKQIDVLQSDSYDIEQNKLPEAEQMKKDADTQNKDWKEKLQKLQDDKTSIDEAVKKLKSDCEQLEKDIQLQKELRDSLSPTAKDYSEKLEELKKIVKDLRDKSDEEKYQTLKQNYLNEKNALEDRQKECEKLTSDIKEMKEKLAKDNEEVERLKNMQSKVAATTAEINRRLEELALVQDPAYTDELNNLKERLSRLETAADKLKNTIKTIAAAIGRDAAGNSAGTAEELRTTIKNLQEQVKSLGEQLLNCATEYNNYKLEVR